MEAKSITIRQVANGYVVETDHPIDGEKEMVFTKYFQVQRFVKEFLSEKE